MKKLICAAGRAAFYAVFCVVAAVYAPGVLFAQGNDVPALPGTGSMPVNGSISGNGSIPVAGPDAGSVPANVQYDPFNSITADAPLTVKVGGEIEAGITGYVKELLDNSGNVNPGELVKASLNFFAAGDSVEAFVKVKFAAPPYGAGKAPAVLDEAYAMFSVSRFNISAGLRKLTWGKADSEGPLDVVNPRDYSDLSLLPDINAMKVAQPLVHFLYNASNDMKFEAVFVPLFQSHIYAESGRWEPLQNAMLKTATAPDTQRISCFQAGGRFSLFTSYFDLGLQYYYGLLPRPALIVQPPHTGITYNRYQQIGADFAAIVLSLNTRLELAANFTEDMAGDSPSIYNPHIVWSLGFDRSFGSFNVNLQCNQRIRLFDEKVGASPFDVESGTDLTATRIIAELSYGFLRDTVKLKTAAIWVIEDSDALIMPALSVDIGDINFELASGIFAGSSTGEFGQYKDNNFIRAAVKYMF